MNTSKNLLTMFAVLGLLVGIVLAQQPVNVATVGGTAPSTAGKFDVKGADGDVFVRCNAASTCPVNANQAGTWNVRNQDGAGNALTSNSSTFTAKFALDMNLLGTLGTAFTTAGKVDIKGADGDVFVRQATGTNLHVVCDSGCSASSTISLIPSSSGGLTLSHTVSAASTNATSLKATAGQVYEVCNNSNAAYPTYLKLYNKASAPTVGTDTPVMLVEAQAGVPNCKRTEEGFTFGTGIAWALTKGIADSDSTAVLINDAAIEISYK